MKIAFRTIIRWKLIAFAFILINFNASGSVIHSTNDDGTGDLTRSTSGNLDTLSLTREKSTSIRPNPSMKNAAITPRSAMEPLYDPLDISPSNELKNGLSLTPRQHTQTKALPLVPSAITTIKATPSPFQTTAGNPTTNDSPTTPIPSDLGLNISNKTNRTSTPFPILISTPSASEQLNDTLSPSNNISSIAREILNGTKPSTTQVTDLLLDIPTVTGSSDVITYPPRITNPSQRTPSPAPPIDIEITNISVSGSDTFVSQTNRYIFNAMIGLTVVFLAFFHYISLNPSSTNDGQSHSATSWELPTFVMLMQSVAIISMTNAPSPNVAFIEFIDSLSWFCFLIRGSADTSASMVEFGAMVTESSTNYTQRLLKSNSEYSPFGLYQFALRIHVPAKDLYLRGMAFFFFTVAFLLIFIVVVGLLSPRRSYDPTDSIQRTTAFSHIGSRFLGFILWFLSASILPLSALSMNEIMLEIRNTKDGICSMSSVFALITIVILALAILISFVYISRAKECQLSKYRMKIIFGMLYMNLKYKYRSFFAVGFVIQLLTGLILARFTSISLQMPLLVGLRSLYLLSMLVLRPFTCKLQWALSCLVELLLISIYLMVYFMAKSINDHIKWELGLIVTVIVCVLISGLFVFNLVKLWSYIFENSTDEDNLSIYRSNRTPRNVPESDRGYPKVGNDEEICDSPFATTKVFDDCSRPSRFRW